MKCARCFRPIQTAAAWSGGSPFGPKCAEIMGLVPTPSPREIGAHGSNFRPQRRSVWVDVGQQEMFEGADMSRKKCIRKHWNTSPGFNPVLHAIAGACITNQKTLDALVTRMLLALDAMTHGNATLTDYRELVDLVNVCETCGLEGIGPEVLPFCEQATDDLLAAARRFEKSQQFGLSGVGIQALRELVEYHRLQILSVPRSKYEQIIKKTANRLRSGANNVVVF